VRYSPKIAAWIREKGACEDLEDGSVAVRFPVVDPGWVVRHVLQYGAEAEVLEPASVREMVVATACSIVQQH
jgi:predicted DNA-binding transcriptional regulator YafY